MDVYKGRNNQRFLCGDGLRSFQRRYFGQGERVETTVGEHGTKIEKLAEHAARSETDMEWMKKTVEGYDTKQQAVLTAIESLKK